VDLTPPEFVKNIPYEEENTVEETEHAYADVAAGKFGDLEAE